MMPISDAGERKLVVLALQDPQCVTGQTAVLRRAAAVVYVVRSFGGCLRVAAAIRPDVVVLHPSAPQRIEHLLRSHASSANAAVLRCADCFQDVLRYLVMTAERCGWGVSDVADGRVSRHLGRRRFSAGVSKRCRHLVKAVCAISGA
jgi:hypothetical protein